jgi:hypothetical protein
MVTKLELEEQQAKVKILQDESNRIELRSILANSHVNQAFYYKMTDEDREQLKQNSVRLQIQSDQLKHKLNRESKLLKKMKEEYDFQTNPMYIWLNSN